VYHRPSKRNVPKPHIPPKPLCDPKYLLRLTQLTVSVYHASLGFRVRVRILGLGFYVRVRVIVSITGSGSYSNENFVLFTVCGAVW